jgi:PIN domain nuclease of toxin-antitoxin system
MEQFVADTNALIWHLTEDPLLGESAKKTLLRADRGEVIVHIPAISLFEMIYLTERPDPPISRSQVEHLLQQLRPEGSYRIAILDEQVIRYGFEVPRDQVPDMPDRAIGATALALGFPLLSKDERLRNWRGVPLVWD